MTFLKEIDKLYKKILNAYITKQKEKNIYFKNSTTKRVMNNSCSLSFTEETEKKKKQINEHLKTVIKKYINEPEKLIQFIKLQGIKVYRINNAEKILNIIEEEEGFISPLKGIKALYMNLIIGVMCENKIKICFNTKEMIILGINNTEIYTVARAIYKYYGLKNNLPGYDFKSQEIFKKVYSRKTREKAVSNCSIKDMYACKEAIARDLESINFTIELSKEYEGAKKALNKIKQSNSANI